jgi:hypothetical protein
METTITRATVGDLRLRGALSAARDVAQKASPAIGDTPLWADGVTDDLTDLDARLAARELLVVLYEVTSTVGELVQVLEQIAYAKRAWIRDRGQRPR